MTGQYIHRPTQSRDHHCAPPSHHISPVLSYAKGELGTLWRCDCGKLWQVVLTCQLCRYGGHLNGGQCWVGTTWIPATLTQRLRAALRQRRADHDRADEILGRKP